MPKPGQATLALGKRSPAEGRGEKSVGGDLQVRLGTPASPQTARCSPLARARRRRPGRGSAGTAANDPWARPGEPRRARSCSARAVARAGRARPGAWAENGMETGERRRRRQKRSAGLEGEKQRLLRRRLDGTDVSPVCS